MQDFQIVEKRTKPYVNAYVNIGLYFGVPLLLLYFWIYFYDNLKLPNLQSVLLIPIINFQLLLGVLSLILLLIIYRNGSGRISFVLLILGMVLIIGGILFDVTTTVINNPTLEEEGNWIVRALMGNGFPLKIVYFYGFAGQVLIAMNMCLLWVTFLRHKETLILLALSSNPKSYLEFLEAVWGIRELTWKQRFFMSLKIQKLKMYYHFWFIPIIWLGIFTPYRWYLGLEWLNLAPVPRNIFLALWIPVGCILYFIWLWHEFSRRSMRTV